MTGTELVSAFDDVAATYAGWGDPAAPRGRWLRVRRERVLGTSGSNFFDAVVRTGVIDFTKPYEAALREMMRVIKVDAR